MSVIVDIARRLAAGVPSARLACPICGVALNAPNLDRHLGKVHPAQDDAGTTWRGRGWKGGRLSWDAGVLEWRSRTGLRRRRIEHVRSVAAGTTRSTRTASTSVTPSFDYGDPTVQEKSGSYVQVRGDRRPITVRCRSGGTARKAWLGWDPGPRVTSWQVTVDPDAFVALLYLLYDADVLRPKTA